MNKKTFLLIIALFLSVDFSFAQVKVDRRNVETSTSPAINSKINHRGSQLAIKYGVKGGVTLSNMSNDMTFDPHFSMGTGVHVGAVVNFHWGQRTTSSLPGTGIWGLQTEVLFSQQSVKTDDENLKFTSIKVPLMLKIYPLSALSIECGPEFAYIFSTSPDELTVDGVTVRTGDCKGFNIGAGIGANYEFPMGLMMGARYSLGFTDFAKNLKWKNNSSIQISVGWMF